MKVNITITYNSGRSTTYYNIGFNEETIVDVYTEFFTGLKVTPAILIESNEGLTRIPTRVILENSVTIEPKC